MFFELHIELDPDEREIKSGLESEFESEAERIVRDAVRFAPVELRQQMAGSPPTGRKYRRRGGGGFKRFHVASSRGNPPRNDTFALSKSFKGRMTGKLEGEVSMLWYGAFHDENGRPFIEQAFTNAIERAI